MNWLAHVFLSKPDIEHRMGNLLADLVRGADRKRMTARFQQGMECHQAIDIFTDYHPVVDRSRSRISPDYDMFRGILIDVFYDHFLARNWEQFATASLEEFSNELRQEIQQQPWDLPDEAQQAVARLLRDDRLISYADSSGIYVTLQRVAKRIADRTGRAFALENAVSEMEDNFTPLEQDFLEFFPLLQQHVDSFLK